MDSVNKHILAIIPARGGSVGVPRKNVTFVAGKPMIAWTIEAAKASVTVSRVIVSTDDAEIAKVSLHFGAEVVKRPAEISGGDASSESALLHVLGELNAKEGYEPDLVVFLQCTSPLTTSEDIDNCVNELVNAEADSALSVTDFHYFIWKSSEEGDAVGVNHDKVQRLRRQDRKNQNLESGAVYVMKTEGFLKHHHRFFGKTVMYNMPPKRCFEIDNPVDLKVAEVLMREQLDLATNERLPKPISALIMDFDGVFTDNKVTVDQHGVESVRCSRGDGMGISLLKKTGLPIYVISTETNLVTAQRCKKLGINCFYGVQDKLRLLKRLCSEENISPGDAIFMGNDINDRECLEFVGCGVVVADAHPAIIPVADVILKKQGGDGAVRELCDLILGRSN